MKTIEEAAKEYADRNVTRSDIDFLTVSHRDIHDYMQDAVHYGVQFAQQWISVDDELPEINEPVLIKFKKGSEFILVVGHVFMDGLFYMNYSNYFEALKNVIEWRPIEYK